MGRAPIDDLLHRVNNLLGVIQLQAAAAQAVGTPQACLDALRLIRESADRTQQEVARFRATMPGSFTTPAGN